VFLKTIFTPQFMEILKLFRTEVFNFVFAATYLNNGLHVIYILSW
jgi:hypothetical protein